MNDELLRSLEDAMNAWESEVPSLEPPESAARYPSAALLQSMLRHRVEETHEVADYVKRKNFAGVSTVRHGGTRPHPTVGERSYGYQQPTLFEKRKPGRRLPPLEERHRPGNWNFSVLLDEGPSGRRSVPLCGPSGAAQRGKRENRVVSAPPMASPSQLHPIKNGDNAPLSHERLTTSIVSIRDGAAIDSVHAEAERPAIPNPDDDRTAALHSDVTAKLRDLEQAREERVTLAHRLHTLQAETVEIEKRIAGHRAALQENEKRLVKAKDAKKEGAQLAAALRSKEVRLVELRNMLKACSLRVAEAKARQLEAAPAAVSSGNAQLEPQESAQVTLPPLRVLETNGAQNGQRELKLWKEKGDGLTAEIKRLELERNRLASVARGTAAKHQLETSALLKQRQKITEELERRAKSEFESAKQHILQNHEKGMNFRSREVQHTIDGEQKKHQHLLESLEKLRSALRLQGKSMSDLTGTESALRVQLKDAEARLAESERESSALRASIVEDGATRDALQHRLDSLVLETRLLSEKLSDPKEIASVQAVHEGERRALVDAIGAAQHHQRTLALELGDMEREQTLLSVSEGKPVPRQLADLKLRLTKFHDDSLQLQSAIDESSHELEARKRELARARKQLAQQLDRTIEDSTKELASWKEKAKQASKVNVQIESNLDVAERMIAMNNLRNK